MAGSYKHCTADDGNFTMDLIDNMGDAEEALLEMWCMIQHLSGHDQKKIEWAILMSDGSLSEWLSR